MEWYGLDRAGMARPGLVWPDLAKSGENKQRNKLYKAWLVIAHDRKGAGARFHILEAAFWTWSLVTISTLLAPTCLHPVLGRAISKGPLYA